MEPQVVFYRLSRKIVNNQENIPEDARQVMYYSLAIGHHVGVMDCFSELMVVPAEKYKQCLDRLPEGEGRRKLEGALKWNEIEINRSHVDELLPALNVLVVWNGQFRFAMGPNNAPLPPGNGGGTGFVFDGEDARMKKKLVVTVGNEMMGDDAAGPLLARMIRQSPLEDWEVLDGGNVPENYVFKIREMEPEQVIIVDAADMDLQAGEIRLIDKDGIGSVFLMTTHSLPLNLSDGGDTGIRTQG